MPNLDQECIDELLELWSFDNKPLDVLIPISTNDFLIPALRKRKNVNIYTPPTAAGGLCRRMDDFTEWWKDQITKVHPLRFDVAFLYGKPQKNNPYGTAMRNEDYAQAVMMLSNLPVDTIIGMVPSDLVDTKYAARDESALAEARLFLITPHDGEKPSLELAPDEDYTLFTYQT